jgi:hypothetical protein
MAIVLMLVIELRMVALSILFYLWGSSMEDMYMALQAPTMIWIRRLTFQPKVMISSIRSQYLIVPFEFFLEKNGHYNMWIW